MQSLLLPAQESYLLLRILNGSFQALDSLKDQISLYFAQFFCSKSGLDLIDSRSISCDRNEKKEISDGEGEPRGAVFNALDAMLKGSLDRLKTMRESIAWGHTGSSDAILETKYSSDITMIKALCLEGKLGTALWLWRTMVQQLRIPDVLTHNYLLNGLCKSGDLGRAEWLVKEMLHHGPSPTCATYNTLMSGYCLVNKVDKALDLFSTMADHGIRPNRVSCNILVHTLCQKGLLEDARKLLEKILEDGSDGKTSDLITSTILMDGYFKTGNMAEALTCWNDVFQRGIEVDVVAYNVMIHGFCLTGDINLVYKSLCEMFKSGHLPDIFTYNTLISNLCKSGRTNEACYVFSVMSRMGVPPDHITYKMIIQAT
ncbi:pentatricopeptide repeat-containing protein At5g24830 isoform X2 [Sesamum indicum]|uniref:Pentatricopeptide repeat-containing protein At5g24830 isoform X2 n=1 Tax=Sesamum indicum TaxID=4182 RepID=A0A6I9T4S1_SESIN|nr:pentatricopeptide repeat-containing protein At5g24830 isoform X2 [Sesamum indicum]